MVKSYIPNLGAFNDSTDGWMDGRRMTLAVAFCLCLLCYEGQQRPSIFVLTRKMTGEEGHFFVSYRNLMDEMTDREWGMYLNQLCAFPSWFQFETGWSLGRGEDL